MPISLCDVPAVVAAPFSIHTLGGIRHDLADDEVSRAAHRVSAKAKALPVEESQHTWES